MEKLIFFGLVIPIFLFVLYLGGTAIMTGFSAKEANRKIISSISKYHFAPTLYCKKNLLKEGYKSNSILVTGNTVIDALNEFKVKIKMAEFIKWLSYRNHNLFTIKIKKAKYNPFSYKIPIASA